MQNTFDNWEGTGEYLKHYGVLGMKWGQRRYQNSDGSLTAAGKEHYQYQSHATKKYTRKAAKAREKLRKSVAKDVTTKIDGNNATHTVNVSKKSIALAKKVEKYDSRAKRSAELDRREQEGSLSVSTGKALATRFLLGGAASKAYHQNLAMMGTSANKASAGQKNVARIMSYFGGTAYSRLMKAAYIRKGEGGKLSGLGNKMIEGGKTTANVIDRGAKDIKRYANGYRR